MSSIYVTSAATPQPPRLLDQLRQCASARFGRPEPGERYGEEKEEPPKRKTARLIPFSQLALWISFFKIKPTYQATGTFISSSFEADRGGTKCRGEPAKCQY